MLAVVTTIVLEPELLIVDGLKVAIVPVGNPEAARATDPLNPWRAPAVTV